MLNKVNFQVTKDLVRQTSFGVVDEGYNVLLDVEIAVHEEHEAGWFEFYDVKTSGNDWYAEGSLTFDGKNLVDYDGVFQISDFILDKLEEMGFCVDDMR